MSSLLAPGLVSIAIGHVPRPLLRLLDDWSHRRALQRAAQRRQRWEEERTPPSAAPSRIEYQLKPWRD
jgi:hypothetical protein